MGFFGKLFGKKDDVEEVAVDTAAKSTEKTETQATFTIDMSKEHLNNVLIDMSKGSKIDMTKHTARVALAMDYSGSMDWLLIMVLYRKLYQDFFQSLLDLMIMANLRAGYSQMDANV